MKEGLHLRGRAVLLAIVLGAGLLNAADYLVRARFTQFSTKGIVPACGYVNFGVLAEYDSAEVIRGSIPGRGVYVVHSCVEMSRREYSDSTGNLRQFVKGDWHLLALGRKQIVVTVLGDSATLAKQTIYHCIRADSVNHVAMELPAAIRRNIDSVDIDWDVLGVVDGVRAYFRASHQTESPECLAGDFNGDGKRDWAIQIVKSGSRSRTTKVIAFIANTTGFTRYELGAAADYILLQKKGMKDHDYESDRAFAFTNDAVQVNAFEKAAWSYVYRGGRFQRILTSD